MFLDYYQMQEQPFGVTPDPRYLFLGESHREALASLFCGIEANRGFMALIAHPGMGKTTLAFQLLEKLQETCRTVFLFQTQCNSHELFHYILNDLGVDSTGMDMVSMHGKLNEILARERIAGRRFVLAIDEAQNLDAGVLETIRLLSNFETSRSKLIQILLIGQPQLAHKLAQPSLLQLEQRIAMLARLEPFGPTDTANYIAHRLRVAGMPASVGDHLFTPGALRIIADRSHGIPRNINSLCYNALALGCALTRKRIDAEIMQEVIADMNLDSIDKPVSPRRAVGAPAVSIPAVSVPVLSAPIVAERKKAQSRMRNWALGIAGAASSVIIAGAFLFFYSNGIMRFRQQAVEKSAMTRGLSAPATIPSETAGPPDSIASPSANLDTNANASITPFTSADQSDSTETIKVFVHSGDTLRRISLRTFGRNDAKIIKQIQKLNPSLTDPDHIEADQEIRLPLLSMPARASDGETADFSAKAKDQGSANE